MKNILYACQGKLDSYSLKRYDFRQLRYHTKQDNIYTLDWSEKVKPDIWMNLEDQNMKEIKNSEYFEYFDIIIMQYCPFPVFIERDLSVKKNTFKNCYSLLKKGGLLYINNFRHYNKPTKRYFKSFNFTPEEFIKPISKLFKVFGLEKTEKRAKQPNETLILQKI